MKTIDMTQQAMLDAFVQQIKDSGEELDALFCVAHTLSGRQGFAAYGTNMRLSASLAVAALDEKDMRPVIHKASDAIKHFEREYDAGKGAAEATVSEERLVRLLEKGGKA